MSVSFCWEVVKPSKARTFNSGTSSDVEILRNTFGEAVSTDDVRALRAMDLVAGQHKTLWGDIADTLERLSGDDAKAITIKIWTEY